MVVKQVEAGEQLAEPDAIDAGKRPGIRIAIPLPGRAQALRARNARSAPHPARTAAADFPRPAAGSTTMRSPATAPAASPAAAPWHPSRRSGPKENHGHHQ
jgi:hypothetical protein